MASKLVEDTAKVMLQADREPLRRYLYSVRNLVTPRLSKPEWRERVGTVPIFVGYEDEAPTHKQHNALNRALGYHLNGVSYPDPHAMLIVNQDSIALGAADRAVPWGQMLAFVTIHELGHTALNDTWPQDQHEMPEWAQAVTEMGIKETMFSKKGPDWEYGFKFADMALWAQIRALGNYPGDVIPTSLAPERDPSEAALIDLLTFQ